MPYLIAALIMTTVMLVVFVAAVMVPARGRPRLAAGPEE